MLWWQFDVRQAVVRPDEQAVFTQPVYVEAAYTVDDRFFKKLDGRDNYRGQEKRRPVTTSGFRKRPRRPSSASICCLKQNLP